MPPPPTRTDTVVRKFSDLDIFQRVAAPLSDGSMVWKVDIVGGLTLDTGDINIGAVNLLNAADLQTNPATEETLLAILEALGGADGTAVHEFDTATSVPASAETDVLSYAVPAGKTLSIKHAHGSGNLYAIWRLKVDSVIKAVRRASDGGGLNAAFDFSDDSNSGGVLAAAGQVVSLTVEHNRPWAGDFEADLTGGLT